MTKRLIVVLATLASMLAIVSPARAADTLQPGDPGYDDITTTTLVNDGAVPVGVFDPLTATNKNCTSVGYHIEMKNKVGVVLAKVGSSLQWCYRNGQDVSKDWGAPWCWTSIVTLWNCQNQDTYVEDQSKQTLPRAYLWRQWRFHLHYCVVWYCKDQWPWIYVGGRGDGTSGTNGGLG